MTAVPPRPAAREKCAARIFPAWANQWVNCNSPIVQGRCARYGHLADSVAEAAPDASDDRIAVGHDQSGRPYAVRLPAPDTTAGDGLRVHDLKTWPEFFEAVASGSKPFEVRRNDRDYRVGDTLLLREYHPPVPDWGAPGGYTGREVTARITYVFDDSGLDEDSVQPGYVVLGLALPALRDVLAAAARDAELREAVTSLAVRFETLGEAPQTDVYRVGYRDGYIDADNGHEPRVSLDGPS